MITEWAAAGPGIIYQFTNRGDLGLDVDYASITAPRVVRCDIVVDGVTVDTVFAGAGGSHSWWTSAGGKLLRRGLLPGQELVVKVDGPAVFRIDWHDE